MFPMQGAWVQSLGRELRSHMLTGTAKNKTKYRSLESTLLNFPLLNSGTFSEIWGDFEHWFPNFMSLFDLFIYLFIFPLFDLLTTLLCRNISLIGTRWEPNPYFFIISTKVPWKTSDILLTATNSWSYKFSRL